MTRVRNTSGWLRAVKQRMRKSGPRLCSRVKEHGNVRKVCALDVSMSKCCVRWRQPCPKWVERQPRTSRWHSRIPLSFLPYATAPTFPCCPSAVLPQYPASTFMSRIVHYPHLKVFSSPLTVPFPVSWSTQQQTNQNLWFL